MKPSHLLFAGLAALSLTACGATTGGATKNLVQQKPLKETATIAAPTTKVETQSLSVPANALGQDVSCETLTAQIAAEDTKIAEATQIIEGDKDTLSKQVGKMALNQGASRALKSVPFGGFLAKSVVKTAMDSGKISAELAQANMNEANIRKAQLSGLYAGKGCGS